MATKHTYIYLFILILNANLTPALAQENPFFNAKGKLIIIGGGNILDSLFTFFANDIGGKDQPIVYIPTATTDEKYIQEGGHLEKFTSKGFTHVNTIHTRNKQQADHPKNIALLRDAKGLFFGGGDQQLLADAYAGTKLYEEFIALLNRGGVIWEHQRGQPSWAPC